MASQTATHRVIYCALRNRGLRKIAMACGTRNTGLVMRRVPKFYMSSGREAVNAYPRNFDVLVGVSNDFLHFRLLGSYLGVTEHAFPDRGNGGSVANIGSSMTIDTLHSNLHMSAVWKCDGLLRCNGRSTIREASEHCKSG